MTKKHLLFALIVCMSTVWRFLELLEYGESATAKKAKEQKPLQGSVSEQQNQTTKK